ncbi:MarR family winged helix-turn-helix transcriptional regulator [Aurantiacibacter gilvus]|uniref:MarR family transcriptional regulator n=1 Tax=Aurantiacibacter gilvus TaxID=3139141 RepID=A0ABU9IG13_9SPHN
MTTDGSPTPVDLADRHKAIDAHIHSPAHLIARADQMVNAGYLQRCRADRLKLTLPQLLYLCAVAANPGGHQAAAARMVGMDTPTGALVISALERRGLVERRQCDTDKRRKQVYCTDEGDTARARGLAIFATATRNFMEPASRSDRQELQRILEKIAAHEEATPPPLCNADGKPITVPGYLPADVLLGYLFGRCLQLAVALVAPALAPFDLTIRQYVVLAMLDIAGPCNMTLLNRVMGSERSAMAIVLPTLEGRGLVSIHRETDRSLSIALTESGRLLLAQARPEAEAANRRIASGLSDTERLHFTETLTLALSAQMNWLAGAVRVNAPANGIDLIS